MPWVLWVSLGTLWVTFGHLLGDPRAAFGSLWARLGTPLGTMPKKYPKQTLGIAPGRAKILPKRVTVINFHMRPNLEIGSQTAPETALEGAFLI